LVVFLIGSISLYAQVSSKVDAALSQFEREYPEYAGTAGMGSRSAGKTFR
jgi:hypothetical protein